MPASVKLSLYFQVGHKLWVVVTFGLHFGSLWPSRFFPVTLGFGPAPSGCTACGFFPSAAVDDVQCSILGLCTAVYFCRWNCKIPPDAFDFFQASIPFIIRCVFKLCRAWTAGSYLEPTLHPRVHLTPLIVMDCAGWDRHGSWRSLVTAATAWRPEFLEGSFLVGVTLKHVGFKVIAAPTRHQVWYRDHHFNFQCEFNSCYGSIELLWKVFLHRLVLTEVKEEHQLMESAIPIIAAMFRSSRDVLHVP